MSSFQSCVREVDLKNYFFSKYSHIQLHIYMYVFRVTASYLDLPSHILYCRHEQTPLLALRPQLQADPSPPPGSIRGRELQTSRVSLETRPGQRLLSIFNLELS